MDVWKLWRWIKLLMWKNYKSGEIMKKEEDE
jgi:hypothetical protein